MAGALFVCYSSVDGQEFALRLADDLVAGPPPYPVWVFARDVQPGDPDPQVVGALQDCECLLFVMTVDSVSDESECKPQWVRALQYKKAVIPLQLHADAELPFRLEPRTAIVFMGTFDQGLARIRNHLAWRDTPEGGLHQLRERLRDAKRELVQAVDGRRALIESEIGDLEGRIRAQEQLIADPQGVRVRTDLRIAGGLEREREPEQRVVVRRTKFVNAPPLVAPTWFQDRHVETGQIGAFLGDDGLRVMTVVGRGGVGKTAMVCRLLKSLEAGRLPDDLGSMEVDGIVYLSKFGGHPVSFANVFAGMCQLLPDEVAERLEQRYREQAESAQTLTAALLAALPTGRTVVLLDNFEDVVDAETFDVTETALDQCLRSVLTASPHGVKVLITTRVAPRAVQLVEPSRQRRLDLDEGLASPYAEHVLRAMDPDGDLGLKHAPEALLSQAQVRTRGYPRALELLAGILAADRNTSLPEVLTDAGRLPGDVVDVLVGEAFNRLDLLTQQVMQALAVYGVAVPAVAVDYLLQPYRSGIDSAPVLGRLVNMHFARRDVGRYYVHQIDRDYALARLPVGEPGASEDTDGVLTQHALLSRGADYFAQTRTPRETWKNLDDLAAQLSELELRFRAHDYDTAASVLLDIDFDYLMLWGHTTLVVDLHERLQHHLTDRWHQGASLTNLASCYRDLGQIPKAIDLYEQALAIDREIGDRQGEGIDLGNLATCYRVLGQIPLAIDFYERALAIAREIGDRQGEGGALTGLANCYRDLGQIPLAIDFYEQALAIDREIGNRKGEGGALTGLANCYGDLGQIPKAIDFYEQALAIAREIGDRKGEGGALTGLASCYGDLGQIPLAIDFYERALAIDREIGDRQGEGIDLGNLASCYGDLGQIPKAIDFYEQALAIDREIGNRQGEGIDLGNLASCYRDLGQIPKAIGFYEQALAIAREIGNRQGEGGALAGLANCYGDLGQIPLAIDFYEQALAIAREIGNRQGEGGALAGLANCYGDLGQIPLAIDFYEQALAIDREIGDRKGEGNALAGLADCHVALGQLPKAIDFYEQALAIDREIGNRQGEGGALAGLASCYGDLGQIPKAIDFYEQALAIDREIGDRQGEGNALAGLADCHVALGQLPRATDLYEQACVIADDVGLAQLASNARVGLASAKLVAGDVAGARATAEAAALLDVPSTRSDVAMTLGVVHLRQGEAEAAEPAFRAAVAHADERLAVASQNVGALDTKALALCGLAILDQQSLIAEAVDTFHTSRTISTAAGMVATVLRRFDTLAFADTADVLAPVRPVAAGDR